MSRLTGWLRSLPSLPLLLGLVVALPAATLILLGIRLLEQDRALAVQRRAELAQAAADRAVRALEQEVAAVERRLAAPAWVVDALPAAGAVHVLITSGGVRVEPPSGTAWYPAAPPLPEPLAAPFDWPAKYEDTSSRFRTSSSPRLWTANCTRRPAPRRSTLACTRRWVC